jgi:hypothetical protein
VCLVPQSSERTVCKLLPNCAAQQPEGGHLDKWSYLTYALNRRSHENMADARSRDQNVEKLTSRFYFLLRIGT